MIERADYCGVLFISNCQPSFDWLLVRPLVQSLSVTVDKYKQYDF